MARGRKAKPTNLKLIQGNPGNRKIEEATPEPEVLHMPAPRYLDKIGADEWRRLMPVLFSWGLFTRLDMAAYAAYCMAYSRWRRANTAVKRSLTYNTKGRNGTMKRAIPEIAIAREASREMLQYMSEFGMTPSARVRLKGTAQGDLFGGQPDEAPATKAANSPWDDL